MAITIYNQPQPVTPALNPETYIIGSSLASSTNQFRFICDVLNSSNAVVTTLKADKDLNMSPNTISGGAGYFDVSTIVRTLIVPNVKSSPLLTGFRNLSNPSNLTTQYNVVFKEQYIDNTTNPPSIITTGIVTGTTRFATFGQLSQMEYLEFSMWTNRFPSLGGVSSSNLPLCSWLTKNVYSDTYDWLWVGQDPQSGSGNVVIWANITYYNQFGVQQRQYSVATGSNTNATNVTIKCIGSGPLNIKGLTAGQCSDGGTNGGGSTLFPDYEGGYYTIRFEATGPQYYKEVKYVIQRCTPYKKIGVWFVNKWGVPESFYFAYKNRQSINVSRNTYVRNVRKTRSMNVQSGLANVFEETSTTIYAGKQKTLWNLNSKILTEDEYVWLQEMIDTPIAWLDLSQLYPTLALASSQVDCVIQNTDYNIVTRANDKQKVLNIQVQESYENNIL